LKQLGRFLTILHVFAKYRLDQLLPDHAAALPIRILFRLIPSAWFASTQEDPWTRLRLALEELGPVFIKFGQLLSTRQDILSEKAIEELSKLQDQVPPFDEDASVAIIEKELKAPVTSLFAQFDKTPLASASIAQVHAAELSNGEKVVIKVVRPNIEKTVRRDLAVMLMLTRWAENLIPPLRRLHPHRVIVNYHDILLDEMDLAIEASNTARFRRNYKKSDSLYIPEVHWDYCTSKVMVQERIYGVPVSDVATLIKNNVDMDKLSERGVKIFFPKCLTTTFSMLICTPEIFLST